MRKKRFDKKLVLNKKTVAHLNKGDMNSVEGGKKDCVSIPFPTCASYQGWTCPTNDPSIVGPCCP
jgi:hypothetical protein